ncbi:hypothetical protein [Halohasta salina]|uniref:hypothetical protein n=1 Tax=Halohasta salina TaxID=2961621 RepID=UPI0020A4E9DD|nr:hypothetical protein [Halohasta salina]
MSRGIKILDGISKWIRESIGPEAENRGQGEASEDDQTNDEEAEDDGYDSPVCCSAASNTDLTVLSE